MFGLWGLTWAIYAGLWAGLLATIVLAINLLLRRWLTAGQMGLLWGLVLVRFGPPIAPSSSLSLKNLLAQFRENGTNKMQQTANAAGRILRSGRRGARRRTPRPGRLPPRERRTRPFSDLAADALPALWLGVGTLLLLWTGDTVNWRFSRRVEDEQSTSAARNRSSASGTCPRNRPACDAPIPHRDLRRRAAAGLQWA